jgi:uncharacterized RDD family membrane protein YckC
MPAAPAPPYATPDGSLPVAPPIAPGMAYAAPGAVALPPGVVLAPVGRRIGAFFLEIVLIIVTLFIGWLIWGLILWGKGTSPALSVLGMKCWVPAEGRPASFWRMALRDIIGRIVGNLFGIMAIVSFVLFVSRSDHRAIHDLVASTIVVHDPNKVLG